MKKIRISATVMFTILLLIPYTSCSFSLFSGRGFRVERISTVLDNTKSPLSRELTESGEEETFELWLMPTERGNNESIDHNNVYNMKKYSILPDGSYVIPITDFPDTSSVVFVVQVDSLQNWEVKGFLSLKIDEQQSLTEFPPRDEITGLVNFGVVSILDMDNTYITSSTASLEDTQDAFSEKAFEELQKEVILKNSGLMALNVLMNTNTETSEYYAVSVSLSYSTDILNPIETAEAIQWDHVAINIYSRDVTSRASLFTPDGTNLSGEGVFNDPYGPQSATQWCFQIPLTTFKEHAAPKALWKLLDENGTELGAFDLSVAMITDNQGNPIIPIAQPDYTVKPEDAAIVDTISFHWYYFDKDGVTKHPLNDPELLLQILGKQEIHLQINSTNSSEQTVTYMYDRETDWNSCCSMTGDLATAADFKPALPVSRFQGSVDLGYRFVLNSCSTHW